MSSIDNEFLAATFEFPARELFIWSVLLGRKEMARLFMAEGRHPIASALMASRLLRRMGDRVKGDDADKNIFFVELAELVTKRRYFCRHHRL